MYEAGPDPYCCAGTSILKNRLGILDPAALDRFERAAVAQRGEEPLPLGRLGMTHYRSVHRHLFQDVYGWAGSYRTVRMSKGDGPSFCYPEHIPTSMRRLFGELRSRRHLRGLSADAFAAGAAHFLAELNAIHPFREGNGRSQNAFIAVLAARAGWPLDLQRLDPPRFPSAMIKSLHGDESGLAAQILLLIRTTGR